MIALVCDGMGGARAGNIASSMAVDVFMEAFLEDGEDSPDLEHMERAGRAARGMEAAGGERRGPFQTAAPDVEKPGAPARRAAGRPEPAGTLTAAQVDLAFRRDSRRYDGGFFLY